MLPPQVISDQRVLVSAPQVSPQCGSAEPGAENRSLSPCALVSVHVRVWDARRNLEFGIFLEHVFELHGFLFVV